MCEQQNTQQAPLPVWSLDHWWTEDVTFEAVAYGPRWNGWATPVVTRETLEKFYAQCVQDKDIMDTLRENEEEYEGPMLELTEEGLWIEGSLIAPNEDGTYSFGFIGWTFSTDGEY